MTQRVRIRRLRPEVRLPAYESDGAAAFDLAAAEEVIVEPGRVALVPTGLVIEVPPGLALGIFARSSTPLKRGLMIANGVGLVDSDYCGPADEVKIAVMNFTVLPMVYLIWAGVVAAMYPLCGWVARQPAPRQPQCARA